MKIGRHKRTDAPYIESQIIGRMYIIDFIKSFIYLLFGYLVLVAIFINC